MNDLQKLGGIAALIEALAYTIGFVGLLTLFTPYFIGDDLDAIERVSFIVDHLAVMQAWYLILYIMFGVSLVVLAVALHERLKADAPGLMQVATPFGLIWAGLVLASGMIMVVGLETVAAMHETDAREASVAWQAIEPVGTALGGGTEVLGGVWLLLLSIAALRTHGLPRGLSYVGVVAGAAGALTVIPLLAELGALFGIGQLLWFVWIGVVLVRRPRRAAHAEIVSDLSRG